MAFLITISDYVMKNLLRFASIKKNQMEQIRTKRECSTETGKSYRPDSFSQWWKRFMESNSDLPRIRFHDLRHTSASLLIDSGENLKAVQHRLGHASMGTTMDIYGHLLPGQINELHLILINFSKSEKKNNDLGKLWAKIRIMHIAE